MIERGDISGWDGTKLTKLNTALKELELILDSPTVDHFVVPLRLVDGFIPHYKDASLV